METQTIVPNNWKEISAFKHPLQNAIDSLKGESIYPVKKLVMRAFAECRYDNLKVVILGQDPYHDGSATGLAFDNEFDKKVSPSLKNILKEIETDTGYDDHTEFKQTSRLSHLPGQGVLLLNTALTVSPGKPGSHSKNWDEFTKTLVQDLNKKDNIIWMLWGNHAKKYKEFITNETHHILTAGHPSPLNTTNPFKGCKHFSKANDILKSLNKTEIVW